MPAAGATACSSAAPPHQHQHPAHASKAGLDELFEHRWRKAYEVRALERETRQGKGQTSSSCGGADAGAQGTADQIAALTLADSGQSAAGQQQAQQRLRQQEVEDDDDDGEQPASFLSPAAAAGTQHHPQQPAAASRQQQQEGLAEEDEEEGEQDAGVRLVWDSSAARSGAAAARPVLAPTGGAAAQLKERGNELLKAGDFEGAVRAYTEGLAAATVAACNASDTQQQQQQQQAASGEAAAPDAPVRQAAEPAAAGHREKGQAAGAAGAAAAAAEPEAAQRHLLAALHSNRAHALLKLKRHQEAAADAQQAHCLHPAWPKPLYRLAQAHLALGAWAAAVGACRAGEALCRPDSEGHTEFTPLLDRVAVHAARAGSLAGYDGDQLEVRSAGEEAWLGRPAPHVPELDGPEDEDALGPTTHLLSLPDGTTAGLSGGASGALAVAGAGPGAGAGGAPLDALAAWDYRQTAAARARRRTSFRSIKEAVAAARDGDRILLRAGVHNGMGESITITKRLLIEGEGALGEATIDQRANSPTFRIARGGVVLRNIDLDQTGFREALLVEGPASVHPLIQGCRVRCSGDDAINTAGSAVPTFLRCTISAKKCGLKASGASAPRFEACLLEKCGEQGLRAHEASAPLLHGCTIAECEEDAVVALDSARVTLQSCRLHDCKGPGVDLSGSAQAIIRGGRIEGCVGGVWLWDAARAELSGASVAGGPSHAILADGAATLDVRESTIRGSVHASEAAWPGILHPSNALEQPEGPTDFPPEAGPFKWTPNPYTRKM